MTASGEEVLVDLDETLDKLIQNAKTLRQIEAHCGFETEIAALQKTQESLLARLTHRELLLKERRREEVSKQVATREVGVENKMHQFKQLFSEHFSSRPIRRKVRVSRRRQRSKLSKIS